MSNGSPSAISRYVAYGEQRPNAHKLRSFINNIPVRGDRFADRLLLAEMHLDMAFQVTPADPHIRQAHYELKQLTDSINSAYRGEGSGSESLPLEETPDEIKTVAVRAHLKRSEIDNWGRAAHGQNVAANYLKHLLGASRASVYADAVGSDAALIEFMPVLLGSRALHRNLAVGWAGRLSLQREDTQKAKIRSEQSDDNPNWDCAAIMDLDPSSFDKPPVKLQVKRSHRGFKIKHSRRRYREAGVIPVSGSECGFADPLVIIASCLEEEGLEKSAALKGLPVMHSAGLDVVTACINRRIDDFLTKPTVPREAAA